VIEIIVFAICLIGASWQSYQSGIKEGASRTVDKLHTHGIIRFDTKGNIKPNKFFDK